VIALVVSRADSASEHVGEQLLDLADWTEHRDDSRADADGGGIYYRTDGFSLRTFDDLHIYLERPDAAFDDPDLLVVVSRHSGETGPLLTAHFTGNVGDAEYGGAPGRFARACPNAAAEAVAALDRYAPDGYEVGTECTHHGPTDVGVPSMFVELGSDEAQWTDPAGAEAVARAVLDLDGDADRDKQVAGFGGGHYAPRFGRIVRETAWAVGHVASDWGLEAMGNPAANRDVLRRAVEASATEYVLVDGDRPGLEGVLDNLGFRVVTETWLRETSTHPLSLVEAVEARMADVSEGLRFGEVVPAGAESAPADAVVVTDLPAGLVDAAGDVDAAATRTAVAEASVAFETTEGGTRPRGRIALPADDPAGAADALTDALAGVLRDSYDEVTRQDGEVIARTEAFDPAAARELGVPEGPAFGRLANGQAVDVDGERIPPETVRTERVERFPALDG